jgi:hypothetical protein
MVMDQQPMKLLLLLRMETKRPVLHPVTKALNRDQLLLVQIG